MAKVKLPSLEIAQLIPVHAGTLCVTSVDRKKCEGKFKYFNSYEEAYLWVHDVSLKQHPEWHTLYCPVCKEDNAKVK